LYGGPQEYFDLVDDVWMVGAVQIVVIVITGKVFGTGYNEGQRTMTEG